MISKTSFEAGKFLAPFFHGKPDTVEGKTAGLDALIAHMESIGTWRGSALYLAQESLIKNPRDTAAQSTREQWVHLGMWGALGCPVARLEQGWAASVCISKIPPELFGIIRPPWGNFVIDIPESLNFRLYLARVERRMAAVKVAFCHKSLRAAATGEVVDGWSIMPMDDNGEQAPQNIFLRSDGLFDGIGADATVPESCVRTMQHLGPLIGALCLAFDSGDRRKIGGRGRTANALRGAKYPTRNEYVIGRQVNVDFSATVAGHIAGRGDRLKIQSVVRGHWKNQPHGLGSTERKFIHIEPYWRGPEDAPIAVRPHILKEPKKKPDDGEGGAAPQAAE